MLDKYFKSLGNIAFVQEGKKGFPTGVPEFAMGTAPVYDTELKSDIDEQKQYARYGGIINPKMQGGGPKPKGYPSRPANSKPGEWVMQMDNLWYKASEVYPEYYKEINSKYWDRLGKLSNPSSTTQQPTSTNAFKPTDIYPNKWMEGQTQPTPTRLGPTIGAGNTVVAPLVTGKKDSGVPRLSGVPRRDEAIPIPFDYKANLKIRGLPVSTEGHEIWNKEDVKPKVTEIEGQIDNGREIDWNLTPWQKLSMGYDAFKYASAKRYMPFRSRFNPSYIDPALVNPEQAIGDIKSLGFQQSQAANVLSPILRNAQQNSIYGKMLDQVAQVRSQYDNQNVGIQNQARQYNNQVRNTAQGVNMKNDQDYYQQSVIGQSQFDNMKSFLGDRFMNNLQGNVQDNQDLAMKLLAQGPNPAYGYDFKRDRFTRNPQNILAMQNTEQANVVSQLLEKLLPQFENLDPRTQVAVTKLAIAKGLPLPPGYGSNFFGQQKKGGTVGKRRNPYQY